MYGLSVGNTCSRICSNYRPKLPGNVALCARFPVALDSGLGELGLSEPQAKVLVLPNILFVGADTVPSYNGDWTNQEPIASVDSAQTGDSGGLGWAAFGPIQRGAGEGPDHLRRERQAPSKGWTDDGQLTLQS